MTGAVLFWSDAALAAFGLALSLLLLLRRNYISATAVFICCAFTGLAVWEQARSVFGECAGAAGTTVPYHDGMTLCPGQSAVMTIEIPGELLEPAPAPAPTTARGL